MDIKERNKIIIEFKNTSFAHAFLSVLKEWRDDKTQAYLGTSLNSDDAIRELLCMKGELSQLEELILFVSGGQEE